MLGGIGGKWTVRQVFFWWKVPRCIRLVTCDHVRQRTLSGWCHVFVDSFKPCGGHHGTAIALVIDKRLDELSPRCQHT